MREIKTTIIMECLVFAEESIAGRIEGKKYRVNGNAGEFNWWFDPQAAQVVLLAKVPRLIIPLDATNTVTLPSPRL